MYYSIFFFSILLNEEKSYSAPGPGECILFAAPPAGYQVIQGEQEIIIF